MDENNLSNAEIVSHTSLRTKLVGWAIVGGLVAGAFVVGRNSVNTDDE